MIILCLQSWIRGVENRSGNILKDVGHSYKSASEFKETLFEKCFSSDVLHINNRVYGILLRCIKSAMFRCKDPQGQGKVGHQTYSNAVRGGPPRPV